MVNLRCNQKWHGKNFQIIIIIIFVTYVTHKRQSLLINSKYSLLLFISNSNRIGDLLCGLGIYFFKPYSTAYFYFKFSIPIFFLLSLLHALLILADSPLAKAQADSVFYQSIQSLTFQIKKETNLPSQLKIKQITF